MNANQTQKDYQVQAALAAAVRNGVREFKNSINWCFTFFADCMYSFDSFKRYERQNPQYIRKLHFPG